VVGAALGVAAGAGGAAEADEPELLESSELDELEDFDELFGGNFVVEALSPLFGSSDPSSVCDGTVGAEQPASAEAPTVERASRDRATSWVAAFICRILWLRSPCSVPT